MHDICPIHKLTNYSAIVTKGVHTLYMFCEMEKYIENVTQFIYAGIQKEAVILVIESKDVMTALKNRLHSMDLTDKQLNQVRFKENLSYYLKEGDQFDESGAGEAFKEFIKPFLAQGIPFGPGGKFLSLLQAPSSKN